MKKYWLLLIPLLFAIFFFRQPIITTAQSYIYKSPCDTPIPYHIGTVDSRFNISRDQFAEFIRDAADVWSSSSGKELFTYNPQSRLTINLVYDERQSLNTQINQLNNNLEEKKKEINPEIIAYEARSTEFRQKVMKLNQNIQSWNEKGGAPPDEYKKLTEEQAALQQEAKELNATAARLNQSTDNYNAQVEELHQTVDNYNDTLQYKPEEGLYVLDNNKEKIDIFFFNTRDEIVHTLAHEMGHALNLSHVGNATSIMFPQTNNVLSPSADDLTELSVSCQKQNMIKKRTKDLLIYLHEEEMNALNNAKNTLENLMNKNK